MLVTVDPNSFNLTGFVGGDIYCQHDYRLRFHARIEGQTILKRQCQNDGCGRSETYASKS
jgi:hypothetical protein